MFTNHTPASAGDTPYVRGSCTDKSWRSANCPSFCVNPDAPYSDNTSGGAAMAKCSNTTDLFYCIDLNTDAVSCAEGLGLAIQGTGRYTLSFLRFKANQIKSHRPC